MSSGTLVVALLVLVVALVAAGLGLVRQRVVQPRRRRAAAALYADVRLQLITQPALAALLDEARRSLVHSDRPVP